MKNNWIKLGCIFDVAKEWGADYGYTYSHKPTPILLDESTIRVYYGFRDKENHTKTSFVDLDVQTLQVKYIHKEIVLDIGKIGTFDDAGAQVCSVVRVDEKTLYMYYIGWNTSTTVPYRNSLGLAISSDNGWHFERAYEGPILERYLDEPYHVGASYIMYKDNKWQMWYNSGNGYKIVNGKPEYTVHIKYAISDDGIHWKRTGQVCIEKQTETEVVVRPSVIYRDGKYQMFYSRRDVANFRTDVNMSYKMGYAESEDGICWKRLDNYPSIEVSSKEGDWDSIMIAYPYVLDMGDYLLAFYNGNKFGYTGFGLAILKLYAE